MPISPIAAVIIGSDQYPYLPGTFSKTAFYKSAVALKSYLQSNALALQPSDILDLFGSDISVERHDKAIADFLSDHRKGYIIITYYVGHGGFLRDRDYFIALKNTESQREHVTALRMRDLAATFKNVAPENGIIIILDCCFSASAVDHWQSSGLAEAIGDNTTASFPHSGTAVLAAASRMEPAITENGAEYTMFSEALLSTLNLGIDGKKQFLSLRDVGENITYLIHSKYGVDGVKPEIHSPRQISGDLASLELFPNPAFRQKMLGLNDFMEIPPDEWNRAPSGSFLARLFDFFSDHR